MLRKLSIALATAAVLGGAALAPSAAEASWRGHYGYGHGYSHSYWKHPHYAYGSGYDGYGYKSYRFHPRWHFGGWKRFGHY